MKQYFVVIGLLILSSVPASAAGPDLYEVRSKHYRIHTDVDRDLASDLAKRMDAMNDEYQRRLSAFQPAKADGGLEVFIFQKQADYLRFTGNRWRNSGGVFMSSRNCLAAFLEGQGRDALRRTLQHEAFHQFAYHAISPRIPIWLNEGISQVFEEGIWTGEGFMLGQVPPRRLRQLHNDANDKRTIPFEQLLDMSNETWARALAGDVDDRIGATQYNQSWAMVHFLIQARDDKGRELYRSRLIRMLELIHAGKSGKDAFEKAFSSNISGFQQRFTEYAAALQATPEASIIERQEVLGDFLIEMRNNGRKFSTTRDFRDTAIQWRIAVTYDVRGMKWSTDSDVSKYFADNSGRAFTERELFFEPRSNAPIPDLVCRVSDRLQLRTRFHPGFSGNRKFEREVLVENPDTQAAAD